MSINAKQIIEKILAKADIKINGGRSWDIQVQDKRFYARVLAQGTLGLGESYMDGWWYVEELDEMINRAIKANLDYRVLINWPVVWNFFKARFFNRQTSKRANIVGEEHYDIGNDLYEKMLDKRMIYSCGYWKQASTLDEAQEAKLDLICQKLYLKPGMKIVDIGCGWGGFAKFVAQKYKANVLGLTISKEQAKVAKQRTKGLPVEIRLQDYRKLQDSFDRVVSIGMFEHVGYKNYREFMKTTYRVLKDNGLQMLHTIGRNVSAYNTDPWIEKYIFPNSMLPSIKQIAQATEKLFVLEDLHSFGADYDKTLMVWYKNFLNYWPEIKEKYGERFKRMWVFWLLASAGGFRARKNQLWQIILSKGGVPGGYESVR